LILISLTLDYYPVLSNEITFLSETGFKNTIIKISSKKKKISHYCIQKDQIVIRVGPEYIWIWVAIELESKEILGMSISAAEQN
jgi:transposase-like protein